MGCKINDELSSTDVCPSNIFQGYIFTILLQHISVRWSEGDSIKHKTTQSGSVSIYNNIDLDWYQY